MSKRSTIVVLALSLLAVLGWYFSDRGPPLPADIPRSRSVERTTDERPATEATQAGGTTVVVLDAKTRAPIPNAEVRLQQLGRSGPMTAASTDSQGRAEFGDLSAGHWRAFVKSPGYDGAVLKLDLDAGGANGEHVVSLAAGTEVRGTVRGPGGASVAKAVVQLRRRPSPRFPLPVSEQSFGDAGAVIRESTTDASGHYAFRGVVVGVPLYLTAHRHGVGRATTAVPTVSPGQRIDLDLQLSPAAGLRGRVHPSVLADGRASVDVYRDAGEEHLVQEGRAVLASPGADFEVSPLSAGKKLLAIQVRRGDSFSIGFVHTVVRAGEIVDVGTWSPGGGEIHIDLDSTDAAYRGRSADVLVQCLESDADHLLLPIHLRATIGRPLALRGLPACRLLLTASAFTTDGGGIDGDGGHAEAQMEFDGSSASAELLIVRQVGARVRVRARLPAGVNGELTRLKWCIRRGEDIVATSSRAPPGVDRYSSKILAPGLYRVDCFGAGLQGSREFEIRGPDLRFDVDSWEPASRIAGVVRSRAGAAVAGALVTLFVPGQGDRRWDLDEVRTNGDGRFVFQTVPDLEGIQVLAQIGDERTARVGVENRHAATVELTLENR